MTYTNLGALQTDQTALYLIGAVAAPVAQDLVTGAILAFTEANITYVPHLCSYSIAYRRTGTSRTMGLTWLCKVP